MSAFLLATGLILGWLTAGLTAAAFLYCWANPVETRDSDTEESGW
jgi:hypothetical protein